MDWTEYASASGGFNRTESLLDVSLSFAPPIEASISEWPKERDELRRRLHRSEKDGVPFGYDTTPRVGMAVERDTGTSIDDRGRAYIEEAFVDCWADLIMGAGWMDRGELTFRQASWAIVSGNYISS